MDYWAYLILALVCAGAVVVLIYFFEEVDANSVRALLMICAGVIFGVSAAVLGCIFIIGNVEQTSCIQKGQKTGMQVEYVLPSGCYVHVDGHLVPYDRWVQVTGVNTP